MGCHLNISIIAGSVLAMIQHLYNTFESVRALVSLKRDVENDEILCQKFALRISKT